MKMMTMNKRLKMMLTTFLCALLLITVVPRVITICELYATKHELLQEKTQLTQINEERSQTLAEIDTPAGIERIAREQLGMVKKGERTIRKVVPQQ